MKPATKAGPVPTQGRRIRPKNNGEGVFVHGASMLLHHDERPRGEKLAELLAYANVITTTPSEARFQAFREKHDGRVPSAAEAAELRLVDDETDDPNPPIIGKQPQLYLEAVADGFRADLSPTAPCEPASRCKLCQLAANPESVVEDFKKRLAREHRRNGSTLFVLAPEVYLRCGLESLGLAPKTACDWVKRAPTPDLRRHHLAQFVGERCCFAVDALFFGEAAPLAIATKPTQERKKARNCYKVATKVLFNAYEAWHSEDPSRLSGDAPYTRGEFVREIARCGGVGRPNSMKIGGKTVSGFRGIALRK